MKKNVEPYLLSTAAQHSKQNFDELLREDIHRPESYDALTTIASK